MEKFKSEKKLIISCIIVFIFTLFLRIHFISLKQGFHGDEVFSIIISNVSEYGWEKEFPNEFVKGKELKKLILFNDTSLQDTVSDLKKLYKDNKDSPHTNLYYSALRVWFTGFNDINIHKIIWRGLSLNLVFFSLSFFIMYKILRRLFKDKMLIPFGLLAAFANTATISNTLFMRPYQLQETVFLLFTLVIINFYKDIENKNLINIKNSIIVVSVTALTLLTGYLAPFYILILLLPLIYKSIKEKQYKNIYFIVGSCILAVLLARLLYLGYFNGFTSYRAKEVNFNALSKDNIIFSIENFVICMVSFVWYVPCIILGIIIAVRKYFVKIPFWNGNKLTLIVFLCAFAWAVFIFPLLPYKIIRYIFPVVPLFAIAFLILVSGFDKKERKLYIVIFSLLITLLSLFPQPSETWGGPVYQDLGELIPYGAKIENLYKLRKNEYPVDFLADTDIPVYIIARERKIATFIPYFNDEQEYLICSDLCKFPPDLPQFSLFSAIYIDLRPFTKYYKIQQDGQKATLKFIRK